MMTPHKAKGGKTYRIDRTFSGVGRIALASGTTHAGTFGRINAMLSALDTLGRIDLLAAIRDRQLAPLLVLHHYERGQLEKLPNAETAAGLMPSLWAFQKRHECGDSYRADLATSIRHIEKVATKASTVGDLPKFVRALKEKMTATPVAFNRLRTHMLTFASDVQGEHSPLWLEVLRVKRFKRVEGRRVRTRLRRPLTVVELDAVCNKFTDYVIFAGARNRRTKTVRRTIKAADLVAMSRTLGTTGMRPAEYWQRAGATWDARSFYIQVNGTKTPAAVRPTFKIVEPIQPVCGEALFRDLFADATKRALGVELDAYSLRRTFAALCEGAGIPESRRQAYLGHGPKTVSQIYLQTHVLPFVPDDAELVIKFMAAERSKPTLALVAEATPKR